MDGQFVTVSDSNLKMQSEAVQKGKEGPVDALVTMAEKKIKPVSRDLLLIVCGIY